MKYVLTYELAEGARALAMEHYPAHRARLDEFHERGVLLLVGTFADEPVGAMGVFTTRVAVDEFMADDPFLLTVSSGAIGCGSGTRSSSPHRPTRSLRRPDEGQQRPRRAW